MKVVFPRNELTEAYQRVSGAVPSASRTTREVLRSVKLEIRPEKTSMLATDQETAVRHELSGVEGVTHELDVLLPSDEFGQILRETESETVELEVDGESTTLRCGASSEFRLSYRDPLEFPPVPSFEDEKFFSCPAGELRKLIHRTVFAAEMESVRYALSGVLFEFEEDKLNLVATDTRRLALAWTSFSQEGAEPAESEQIIVPTRALAIVERSIDEDKDEAVRFVFHSNEGLFRTGQTTVYCRLLEGRFPPYRKAIPSESRHTVDLPCSAFYRAVRQAQIVMDAETRGVDFFFAKGLLTLRSAAAQRGQAKVELPIAYEGEEVVIRFDPQFLVEYLRVLDPGTNVRFRFTDADSPGVFEAEDGYVYVVMPLERKGV